MLTSGEAAWGPVTRTVSAPSVGYLRGTALVVERRRGVGRVVLARQVEQLPPHGLRLRAQLLLAVPQRTVLLLAVFRHLQDGPAQVYL